jgi:hypothetical protein
MKCRRQSAEVIVEKIIKGEMSPGTLRISKLAREAYERYYGEGAARQYEVALANSHAADAEYGADEPF